MLPSIDTKGLFEDNVGSDADYLLICYKMQVDGTISKSWNVIPYDYNEQHRLEYYNEYFSNEYYNEYFSNEYYNEYFSNARWTTIEEAMAWHFNDGWTIIQIYDLYASFETSLIRSGSR